MNDEMLIGTGHNYQSALDDVLARRKRSGVRAAVRVVEHRAAPAHEGAGYTHTVTVAEVE